MLMKRFYSFLGLTLVAFCISFLGCKTTGKETVADESPQYLNHKAMSLYEDGKYTDPHLALYYVNEAILKDPNYGRAYFTRGTIYYDLKKYPEAIDSFSEALKRDPDVAQTYSFRGWVYYTIGEYEKAIGNYTKALEINNNEKKTINNRAIAYLKLGQNQKACADFRKLCELGYCKSYEYAKEIGKCP